MGPLHDGLVTTADRPMRRRYGEASLEPVGIERDVRILGGTAQCDQVLGAWQLGGEPVPAGGDLGCGEVGPGGVTGGALAGGGGELEPLPGDDHRREEVEVVGGV